MTANPQALKDAKRRPVGIDLFAGAGGLSLGFEQAGFDVRAAVEIDPVHCAVHEFNFPDCVSICQSTSVTSAAEIRKRAHLSNQTIDVVFGGAPCQGFSLIGKRALDDPRNALLLDFLRLTIELDANYFVFENVKGITIGEHRKLLDELIEDFDRFGYSVVLPYQVLNAADFGVPQDRKRLFLLGAKKGLPLPQYPIGPGTRTTVWDAIRDLPEINDFDELADSDTLAKASYGYASSYAKRLRGLTHDETDLSHPRIWESRCLTSSMRTVHTPLSQSRFEQTPPGKVEPVSRFLRLDPDGLCNTLRAGTGSERGAFTSPRPIHPRTPRCISVREAARLHSYPDWFRFHVTKWHGFRQIGNSVPPLLGRAVAIQVMRAIGAHPVRPESSIGLGSEALLHMTVTEAARHYGISTDGLGKRTRPTDRIDENQLALAIT